MKDRNYYIYTFGCKMNQYDSCTMGAMLEEKGCGRLTGPSGADIIIVNTCTVTGKSDQRARRIIRKLKSENPESLLVATGCYAEREPGLIDKLPEIDYLVGNADKNRISEIIGEIESHTGGRVYHSDLEERGEEHYHPLEHFGEHTRAFLKIQDGCDASCSYCIIPSVRGKSRSIPAGEVLEQARRLAAKGYREIVLTGIHLGMYGLDLDGEEDLADLTLKLTEIAGIDRVRLSSIEPMEITGKLISVIAESGKTARHLHIPLQSGSDFILRRMNRPYSSAEYLEKVSKIRKRIPGINIGTDLIVGFPGEKEEHFRETCNLVANSPINYLHVFRYSRRPGTPAAAMDDPVPPYETTDRSERLRDLSSKLKIEFRKRFIGEELSCLSLEKTTGEGLIRALSDNYIEIECEGETRHTNKMITLRVTGVKGEKTTGIIEKLE